MRGGGGVGNGIDLNFRTFVGGGTKIEEAQASGEGGSNFNHFVIT